MYLKAKYQNAKENIQINKLVQEEKVQNFQHSSSLSLHDNSQIDLQQREKKPGCCRRKKVDLKQLEADYYKEFYSDNIRRIGKAIVIFEKQYSVRILDQNFRRSLALKIIFYFFPWCKSKFERRRLEVKRQLKPKRQAKLSWMRAPEPPDIEWQNLEFTSCQRFAKILITYLVTLGALLIVLSISWGVKVWKKNLQRNFSHGEQNFIDLIEIRGLTFLTSIMTVLSNKILMFIIRYLTLKERHETQTKYSTSVAFKLTISTFANTALIPLLVNSDQDTEWFSNAGLVQDVFFNLITIAFVGPTLYILDIPYMIKLMKRCRYKKKGKKNMRQEEANSLMQGPPLDIARRNSNSFLIFIFTLFYAPLQPLIVPFAILGALYMYWSQKYILLRRHKRPDPVGPQLSNFYAMLAPWSLLLYAFSNWFWVYRVSIGRHNTPAALTFFIILCSLAFPIRSWIIFCQSPIKSNQDESKINVTELKQQYSFKNPGISIETSQKQRSTEVGKQKDIFRENRPKTLTEVKRMNNKGSGNILAFFTRVKKARNQKLEEVYLKTEIIKQFKTRCRDIFEDLYINTHRTLPTFEEIQNQLEQDNPILKRRNVNKLQRLRNQLDFLTLRNTNQQFNTVLQNLIGLAKLSKDQDRINQNLPQESNEELDSNVHAGQIYLKDRGQREDEDDNEQRQELNILNSLLSLSPQRPRVSQKRGSKYEAIRSQLGQEGPK